MSQAECLLGLLMAMVAGALLTMVWVTGEVP